MVIHSRLMQSSSRQRQLPSANTHVYPLTIEGTLRLASQLPAEGGRDNSYSLQHSRWRSLEWITYYQTLQSPPVCSFWCSAEVATCRSPWAWGQSAKCLLRVTVDEDAQEESTARDSVITFIELFFSIEKIYFIIFQHKKAGCSTPQEWESNFIGMHLPSPHCPALPEILKDALT